MVSTEGYVRVCDRIDVDSVVWTWRNDHNAVAPNAFRDSFKIHNEMPPIGIMHIR